MTEADRQKLEEIEKRETWEWNTDDFLYLISLVHQNKEEFQQLDNTWRNNYRRQLHRAEKAETAEAQQRYLAEQNLLRARKAESKLATAQERIKELEGYLERADEHTEGLLERIAELEEARQARMDMRKGAGE